MEEGEACISDSDPWEVDDSDTSAVLGENPFSVLPPEMLAEILSYVDSQKLRIVCQAWKGAIDYFHGIRLKITNMNWNSLRGCSCAKSILICGFSRDVPDPLMITSRLVSLEIKELVAYYSFMPILEACDMLKSLSFDCVTFLPNSRLQEYTLPGYLERSEKSVWLPRLKSFKFVSCTTQRGVYNHIIPADVTEELYGLETAVRTFDISRGEMEFIPFILQILMLSNSLCYVEMVLTDIWKIPFADLLVVNIDVPPLALDVSLWHFGSKRILPVGPLLRRVNSLKSLTFSFPHHFDHFYMKFVSMSQPPNYWGVEVPSPIQIEEVVIRQSLRWSQEMRDVDIPWLQILEQQHYLKRLEYPFPILGDDQRVAKIISQNNRTLEIIRFVGHRETADTHDMDFRDERHQPWDSEWFAGCENLKDLQLKTHTRFLASVTTSKIIRPNLLPLSLTSFTFHGCIDTGNCPLNVAFSSLLNLYSFTHQARICPWFQVDGEAISELQVSHVKDIFSSIPQLRKWTLEWCDSNSTIVIHLVITTQAQRHSAFVSRQVMDWMAAMTGEVEYCELTSDRQMKTLAINICRRE